MYEECHRDSIRVIRVVHLTLNCYMYDEISIFGSAFYSALPALGLYDSTV